MYLFRAIAISLGTFFLAYVAMSVIIACFWHATARRSAQRRRSGVLYGIRVLPLVVGIVTLVVFVIPSFLYLEPSGRHETLRPFGMMAAVGGAVLLGCGFFNALRAWRMTASCMNAYLAASRRIKTGCEVPVFETAAESPAVLVVGIFRPVLLISQSAAALLQEREMRAAIRHELAHTRARDNLRKLVLKFCPFPFFSVLEREWLRAAEVAADDAAATDERTALDLASALLKMARANSRVAAPELAMSLLPEPDASLALRVGRLLSWRPRPRGRDRNWRLISVLAAGVTFLLVLNYNSILVRVHEITELLVR